MDRPVGFIDRFGNKYPVNYGYVPGIIGGDGEEQDAYILDVEYPIDKYQGNVIAIIHRRNDVEDKWVVSNRKHLKSEIIQKVDFIEKHFDYWIELL